MLTQAILKNLLHYDPLTGVFIWKNPTNQRIKVNSVAGSSNGIGYVKIMLNRKTYRAHRLAWLYMTGMWPKNEIDHKNGIRNDNRGCNLREATLQQNQQNKKIYKNNLLGVKGVRRCWSQFEARIKINNKPISLGIYPTIEEAQSVYLAKAKDVHGEFFKEKAND